MLAILCCSKCFKYCVTKGYIVPIASTLKYGTKLYMITTTISEFRKDLKKYLNKVTQNFEPLIINRGKESGVVVISLEEYNSLQTTAHETSSKKNMERLDSAIAKFQLGDSFSKELNSHVQYQCVV